MEVRPYAKLAEVPTPALVVDLDRMEQNLQRWQQAVARHGVRFRPHAKTHKTTEIARRQLDLGAAGIAVAKVAEAETFVAAGVRDVVVAFPVVGEDKWRRAAALARDARITVNVDSEPAVRGLSRAATAEGATIALQVEVDTGLHRCGFPPDDLDGIESLWRLAESLPGVEPEGVTTHRGTSFEAGAALTAAEAGREEGELAVAVAERLRERGLAVREVTAGGTPTGRAVAAVSGITEVRAGTYVFNDLMQADLGSAQDGDVALTVLATVVSTRHDGHATVDAGSKTLSGDRPADAGPIARSLDGAVALERMSEEHGMARLAAGRRVEVGDRLRLLPWHVCPAVNLADELVAVRGERIEAVWPIAARGRRT